MLANHCYYKFSWSLLVANLLLSFLLLLLSSESEVSARICSRNRHANLTRSLGGVECGKTGRSFTNRIGKHNRISGGYDAKAGEFPSFVSLKIRSPYGITLCSGSLISADTVLTAAHCLSKPELLAIKVGIGIYGQQHWYTHGTKVIGASKWCHSPEWGGIENPICDYGIIILNEPVELSRTVQPACLPEKPLLTGSQAHAVGTGRIDDSGTMPEIAQVLPVKEIACNYSDEDTSHICFSSNQQKYTGDTCVGDSGGPIYADENGRQTVVGITSYGPETCARGFGGYSVNANTYNLKNKILQLIENCESGWQKLDEDGDDDPEDEMDADE